MVVVAREPRANAAFLRLPRSGNHHDLGLFGVGPSAPPKRRGGDRALPPGLAGRHDRRARAGPRRPWPTPARYTGESSHGATKSVYGADPDGNEFEIMWMLPREEWGAYENAAPIDRLDLAAEVRRWTGVRTAGTIVAEVTAVTARRWSRPPAPRTRPAPLVVLLHGRGSHEREILDAGRAPARRASRTQRCAPRSPKAAATPGSPTAASAGRVAESLRSAMDWFRAWLDERRTRGPPVRPGRVQRRRGVRRRAHPRRPGALRRAPRSSTAPCRSTPACRRPPPG